MMTRTQFLALLERMELRVLDTINALYAAERHLAKRAEVETIRRRPKARSYHRRMSRWTGADKAEYRRVLDETLKTIGPELDRLQHRVERQKAAIVTLRRKYRGSTEPPLRVFLGTGS